MTLIQSHNTSAIRARLTEDALRAKEDKGLSWDGIAEGTGLSVVFVTAALLGQQTLPKAAADLVASRLGLGEDGSKALQAIPLRGSIPGNVPTDPTIYRFYEIVQVYGTTLKALVHEQFGDGIISAINFKLDIKRVEDPNGGYRAVISMDGRFLPYVPY